MTTVIERPKKKRAPKKRAKQDYSKQCDILFSQLVRSVGRCESGRLARHGGVLQCAHGISRRYRAVRWDRRNAWSFCQACHMYFTHHPLEWDEWLRQTWGDDLYVEMRALALAGERPDLPALLVELKEARAAA